MGKVGKVSKLEACIQSYWRVGQAVRRINYESMSTKEALTLCSSAEFLPPTQWRIKELMHVLKFDIVEGDFKWRNPNPDQAKRNCQLIRPTNW